MRKFTLLMALYAAVGVSAKNEVYKTADNGTIYTLADLAKIPESGVTADGNTYTMVKDIECVGSDGFKLENNVTLKMGADVLIRVYGPTQFTVTDTATVCPTQDGVQPKGFHLYKMHDTDRTISHVRFEGASFNVGNPQGTIFENCTFIKSNGKLAKYSITFSAASVNNVVRNCHFINTMFSAIGNGSNVAAGITIENNLIEKCSTEGRNYPYLNICPSGNNGGTYIRNNKIIGAGGLMAGAISFSNMLTMLGENKVIIENNEMCDCRYGIQIYGYGNARIINNKIINCHYSADANTGGSGITVYSSGNYAANAYIKGNTIEGNLWGVTIIGISNVNLGYLDKTDENLEYNPGQNIFSKNGNCGKAPENETTAYDPSKPCDLYNNTALTVYAQGNIWGGTDQSAAEIEKYIFHKVDKSDLGKVIFLPAGGTTGITMTETASFDIVTKGGNSFDVVGVNPDAPVTVYDINGIILWHGAAGETVTLSRGGLVIVAVNNQARRIIL